MSTAERAIADLKKHNVQYRENGQCKTNMVMMPIVYVFINIVNDEDMFESVF